MDRISPTPPEFLLVKLTPESSTSRQISHCVLCGNFGAANVFLTANAIGRFWVCLDCQRKEPREKTYHD